jgi:hypothetical protein
MLELRLRVIDGTVGLVEAVPAPFLVGSMGAYAPAGIIKFRPAILEMKLGGEWVPVPVVTDSGLGL